MACNVGSLLSRLNFFARTGEICRNAMNALVLLGWFTVVRFEHSDTEREIFFFGFGRKVRNLWMNEDWLFVVSYWCRLVERG